MTLQNINTPALVWPGISLTPIGSNPAVAARVVLDASGEYGCLVFMAREDMTISHVGFLTVGATGSPTVDVRIETVDVATGLPSGTLWATNTNIVTGALSGNTWAVHALTASATILRGQIFAVKILYNSGTLLQLAEWNNTGQAIGVWSVINAGTPAISGFVTMALGLGSSSTAFYQLPGARPYSSVSNTNFNNTSSGRRGVKFQVPFACRVAGVRFVCPQSAAGDFNVGIWDDAGTEVGSSITAYDRSANGFANAIIWELLFDTLVELQANTNYRAAIEPTSSTNCNMYHGVVSSAALRSGLPGGTAIQLTTYTSGGGWDDSVTTTIPFFDLVIDQIHDGAGGGGGASFHAYAG